MAKAHISETIANGTAPFSRSDLLRDSIQRLLEDNPEYVLVDNTDDCQLEAVHMIDDQAYYHVAYRISSSTERAEKLGVYTPKTIGELSWDDIALFRGLARSKGTAKVASRHYYTGPRGSRIDILEESPSGYDHRVLYDAGPGLPITDKFTVEDAARLVSDLDELEEHDLIKPLGISPQIRFLAKQALN